MIQKAVRVATAVCYAGCRIVVYALLVCSCVKMGVGQVERDVRAGGWWL